MAFSSNNFIFWFLPLYLITVLIIPVKWKRFFLLAFSLCFYYLGSGLEETLLFIGILIVNFIFLRLLEKNKTEKQRKILLALALILDFGLLAYFKYLDFFLGILHINRSLEIAFLPSAIPIGISFFTFQTASVLIDTCRNPAAAESKITSMDYANCIAAFPKLVSGPLVRYSLIEKELKEPKVEKAQLEEGFVWFVLGLGLKTILADPLASVWASITSIGFENLSTPLAWLGALSYSLQLYLDFHGYSLMAMGIGKMTGLSLPRNFLHPYMAVSVTEFWRRWHITLGAWFRDYIYIPLGGSKNGTKRMIFSLFVVWLATGLWHGAGWNFILWGMIQFVFILSEKLFWGKYLKKSNFLSHLYLILIAMQSWVVFAISDIRDIGSYFLRMYPFLDTSERNVYPYDYQPILQSLWWVLLLSVFACFPFAEELLKKYNGKPVVVGIELIIFWVCIYLITKNGSNPFMYLAF